MLQSKRLPTQPSGPCYSHSERKRSDLCKMLKTQRLPMRQLKQTIISTAQADQNLVGAANRIWR